MPFSCPWPRFCRSLGEVSIKPIVVIQNAAFEACRQEAIYQVEIIIADLGNNG
jgi:hypothetical protein